MAKKSPSIKSLKSLFSRSDAALDKSAEKDATKSEVEKRKFRFLKFKTKAKGGSGPGPQSPRVPSNAEPDTGGEDAEAWADNIVSDNKKSSLYATAPRSKGKEFSYSELDLRKPKRFATFSFGLKKKKRKEAENISKSAFGLNSPASEDNEEATLDLSQLELDLADTKTMFSMSQPELDTSHAFDIPAPPPVATNQSDVAAPESQPGVEDSGSVADPLDVDLHGEMTMAPIASIPELQVDDEVVAASSDVPPLSSHTESISVPDVQTPPSLPDTEPPAVLSASDDRASAVESVCSSGGPSDNDTLHPSVTQPEIYLPESTGVTLSNHQPDAQDNAKSTSPTEIPLTVVDAKADESAPVFHSDSVDSAPIAGSASVREEASVRHAEGSAPEAARGVSPASPRSRDSDVVVYGALYESLFPQSFTSEIMSSLSNPAPQIQPERSHLITKPEPVMVKTLNECHTETNVIESRMPSIPQFAAGRMDDAESRFSRLPHDSYKVDSYSSRYSSLQTDADVHHQYQPSPESAAKDIPYSELSLSRSGARSDSFSHVHNTVRSAPVFGSSAPPVTDYVTSQGTDTQVTDSKHRVILVKELVTEEASADSGRPSPVLGKMSASDSLQIQFEAPESFYASSGSGLVEDCEGPLSPAYLSVGSDDGSAMEVYYSAEEDNEDGSEGEDMYTMDEREVSVVEVVKEREFEGDQRVVIVKVWSDGGNNANRHDLGGPVETQQARAEESHAYEIKTPEFLVSRDAERQETAVSTTTLTQIKEEEEEEELPATPVLQVNTLMECEVAPPFSEPHVQRETTQANWTKDLETEDHLDGERRLQSREIEYLSYKETRSSGFVLAASDDTREVDQITPTCAEAAERVSQAAGERGHASRESLETRGGLTEAEVVRGFSTHGAELQSDAAHAEHNRAPQSSEWVDTVTAGVEEKRTARERAAVEPSQLTTDTQRPDTEPPEALAEGHQHPAQSQSDPNHGSLTPPAADRQTDQESVDNMNSGYSSLSTKLTLRTLSPPRDDDAKQRFHKVSLIRSEEAEVDFTSGPEANGTDEASEYSWRNRYDRVSQYSSYEPQDSSESYRASDTSSGSSSGSSSFSSAAPEATTHKDFSTTLSSSSSHSSEEHLTRSNWLGDSSRVYVSHGSEPADEWRRGLVGREEPGDEWRRGLVGREEPAAAAGEAEGRRQTEAESRWDSAQLLDHDDHDSSRFTGLFKATLVELVGDPAAPPPTPPASPDADSSNQSEMDNLVDTLKSMGPSFRPRGSLPRAAPPALVSSLPPIVEDAPSPVAADVPDGKPGSEALNGIYTLPADLGLRRSFHRDTRSPLELMKMSQQDPQLPPGSRILNLPLRAPDDPQPPVLNGDGVLSPSGTGSRLDNSIIFSNYRPSSIDQTADNEKTHRTLYRTSSLPEIGPSSDRLSARPKELGDLGVGKEAAGSRFERLSFLMSSSSAGSLTGAEDAAARMSRPPPLSFGSPPSSASPTRLLSPTGSIDLHKSFTATDSPLSLFGQGVGSGVGAGSGAQGSPILQRSFSSDGSMAVQQSPLFNHAQGGSLFHSKEPEPEKNLLVKYRAFPDAYLTKTKEHGKLNPRPGKIYIFDRPGMCGQRIEVRSDVVDATSWELQETISIRVVRGGWVLYEKPNFKGEKVALEEGDMELTFPFSPPEEQEQNGREDGEQQNGETSGEKTESPPHRRFIIGSLRRAVRDYSVPEISLFPEENAEGKKVVFRDTSDDARIFGFPIKANSIIINAGLWLVFAQPFFQGAPRVLEVGGYTSPAAWGVEQPYVGSLHPLKIGEPRVENMSEPKLLIYEKPYFCGKSRSVATNTKDFMSRTERQQAVFMYNAGSLKVLGGIWVGYEKEGFRGHQYLLEEGEYQDWRVWGGHDAELRSVRLIRADLSDPLMVMFDQLEEEQEGVQENTFEVTEAIPDVELFGYKTTTRSIHVLGGAWVAYSHVDFSGHQYILEKGFYNNCADWGSQDTRICSVQPILPAPCDNSSSRNEIVFFSEPDFQGKCHIFDHNQEAPSEHLPAQSCRVVGGCWVLYENDHYSGNMYVLHEGSYPSVTSMGCPPNCTIRSFKVIPMTFSVPSISMFGLECLEGREITTETEIFSMTAEGFNDHILSVRVNSGCWVIYEHSNYRGRQFLLEPIEITNWPKFSSLSAIGSVYPVRQKRHFFRIRNVERGQYMSVQGGVEEMKSGRVVVTAEVEPMSDVWFYQDGVIKNKLSPNMNLQVMGNIEPAAKLVLWTETRQPIQTWTAQMKGCISSLTFPGMVVDVKGGKSYDKDHVVIMPENEERPSQQWEIELL